MPRKKNKQVRKKPRQIQKQNQTVRVNVKIDQSKRGGARRGGGVSRPPIYSSSITMNAPTVPLPIYRNVPLSTPLLGSNQQRTGLSTQTPLKEETVSQGTDPIPRTPKVKKETFSQGTDPIPRTTKVKKEPLEKNEQKTNLKPSTFPKVTGVAGREVMENIRKEEEEQKRQKQRERYKEKFGDSPSPRRNLNVEDARERRRQQTQLQRSQLQRELLSNKRFIERRNILADQMDRMDRDSSQVPLPDENDDLSDMTYDTMDYSYYGNMERLS